AKRAEAEERQVRLNVAAGMQRVEDGDLFGSLPWLVEALRLDKKAPRREIDRTRLAAVLRQTPKLVQLWSHDGPVLYAEFSPDGRRVVTASADNTARVWDTSTGKPITPPLKHNGPVFHAAFSPDGRRVVTASADGTARIWDAATGKAVTPSLKHGDYVR